MITCPKCAFSNQDHHEFCQACEASLTRSGYLQLFVSHTWADKVHPQFGRLTSELDGYDLWIDNTQIRPGKSIRDHVTEGITRAHVVLVLWSRAAAASAEVQFELQTAAALSKDIIPCRIDDTSTEDCPQLRGRLHINLQDKSADLGWMRLKSVLTDRFMTQLQAEIANMEPGPQRDARAATLADVAKAQAVVRSQIALLDHTEYRIHAGATDRNKSNPYVLNMLRQLATTMAANGSAQALAVQQLMEFIQTLFERLPNDDAMTVEFRNTLLRNKLEELDPQGANPWLAQFAALMDRAAR